MRRASQYDRAVGFFRSTIFVVAWPALRDFVTRGARIRILCSQVLSEADIDALEQGYAARVDESLAVRYLEEVRALLKDDALRDPTRVLAALVARNTVELQIAILRPDDSRTAKGRIFHDKLGIFRDSHEHVVTFKGSMNETWNGLAADGNLESVDVAATWMGARDLERAKAELTYFDDLWSDRYPNLSVRPFPKVAREELESAADHDWQDRIDQMIEPEGGATSPDAETRTLYSHQAAGLASWESNQRKGILEFATGSGKTFTAITAIKESVLRREVVVVVVPDRVLFAQWHNELEKTLSTLGVRILRAGSGYTAWRDSLRLWTSPGPQPRLVLATMRTASSEDFRARLASGTHLMLVADEVHRLGSPRNQSLLDNNLFGPRLGLSATPRRAGDPIGTAAILSFFTTILEPQYTLADAVRDGVLSRYFYRAHTVELADDEAERWASLSADIARIRAQLARPNSAAGLEDRLQRLLIQRARIVKQASGKVPLAATVLRNEFKRDQRWIVYCDDLTQLSAVCQALSAEGIQPMPFHSQMEGSKVETLKWLETRGGVVVAIKCLDEGVDIPSVTHALILASSKNPREFIQRRGRVLRRSPGKSLAYVHDAIVLPTTDRDAIAADSIVYGELARAVEFAQHADNPASATDLQQIAIDSGIDWRTMLEEGVEDAE